MGVMTGHGSNALERGGQGARDDYQYSLHVPACAPRRDRREALFREQVLVINVLIRAPRRDRREALFREQATNAWEVSPVFKE